MGLAPNQPNIEVLNTELYGGPKQYDDFPVNKQHAFAMGALLFNQHSRGSVKLSSADPLENPVVDHNYLDDPLDMLVLIEGCHLANEIAMKGKGTKDIIKGSWPADLTHHAYTSREDWEPYVRRHATTCTSSLLFSHFILSFLLSPSVLTDVSQATTPPVPAQWAYHPTPTRSSTPGFASAVSGTCALRM
jgi:choline dehydrogenase-like flavoprotein